MCFGKRNLRFDFIKEYKISTGIQNSVFSCDLKRAVVVPALKKKDNTDIENKVSALF